MSEKPDADEPPVELPITGELDLHAFAPRDVRNVVEDYIEEACRRGLTSVRIVHGKGMGVLRTIVRSALARRPDLVRGVSDGGRLGGSWGATIAHLRTGPGTPPPSPSDRPAPPEDRGVPPLPGG